ncbi:hypothetical protein ACWCWD_26160 [Streptomyces sp. NPDC001493]
MTSDSTGAAPARTPAPPPGGERPTVCGWVRGSGPDTVVEVFERAGWESHSSSWYGYEVTTGWCQVELDLPGKHETLISGEIDADRLDDFAALLRARFDGAFCLELYDEENELLREIPFAGPVPPAADGSGAAGGSGGSGGSGA